MKTYQDMVRGEAPVQHPAAVRVCQGLQDGLGVLDQGQQGGALVGQFHTAVLAPCLLPAPTSKAA